MLKRQLFKIISGFFCLGFLNVASSALAAADYKCPGNSEVVAAALQAKKAGKFVLAIPTHFGLLVSEANEANALDIINAETLTFESASILYDAKKHGGYPHKIEVMCQYKILARPNTTINLYKVDVSGGKPTLFIGATRYWTVPVSDQNPYAVCKNYPQNYCYFIDKPSQSE